MILDSGRKIGEIGADRGSHIDTRLKYLISSSYDKLYLVSRDKLELEYGIRLITKYSSTLVSDIPSPKYKSRTEIINYLVRMKVWNDDTQKIDDTITDEIISLFSKSATTDIKYWIGYIDKYTALFYDADTETTKILNYESNIDSEIESRVQKYILKQSLMGMVGVISAAFNGRIYTYCSDESSHVNVAITPLHRVFMCANYRRYMYKTLNTTEMRIMSKVNIETYFDEWNSFEEIVYFNSVYVHKSLVKFKNVIRMTDFVAMKSEVVIENGLNIQCEAISDTKLTLKNINYTVINIIRNSVIICDELTFEDIITSCKKLEGVVIRVYDSGRYQNRLVKIGCELATILNDEDLEIIVDRSLYDKWTRTDAWNSSKCLDKYIHPKEEEV